MRYRVLDKKGVIAERSVVFTEKSIELRFDGAPQGATAIFVNKAKDVFYRALKDGICSIDAGKLGEGAVSVTLAVLDKHIQKPCEGIRIHGYKGGFAVSPDDDDLPQTVAELEIEMDELRQKNKCLEEKVEALSEALKEYMEGWDIT